MDRSEFAVLKIPQGGAGKKETDRAGFAVCVKKIFTGDKREKADSRA